MDRKLLVLSAMAIAACIGGSPTAQAQLHGRWTLDAAAAERGKQDFVATCSFCHGSDARGSPRAPDLLRSELVNRDDNGELIGAVVLKGRTDKGMPSFPNLTGQIADIAMFLHSRVETVMDRMAYPIANIVTGDPKEGQAYFNGPGQCSGCHSVTGDLAGIGAKYKPADLQAMIAFPGPNLISYMGYDLRHIARPPVQVTVTPQSGSAIKGTAVFIGEYDIALRDQTGAYRSFSRDDGLKIDIHDPLDAHWRLLDRYTDADIHNLLAYLTSLK